MSSEIDIEGYWKNGVYEGGSRVRDVDTTHIPALLKQAPSKMAVLDERSDILKENNKVRDCEDGYCPFILNSDDHFDILLVLS